MIVTIQYYWYFRNTIEYYSRNLGDVIESKNPNICHIMYGCSGLGDIKKNKNKGKKQMHSENS